MNAPMIVVLLLVALVSGVVLVSFVTASSSDCPSMLIMEPLKPDPMKPGKVFCVYRGSHGGWMAHIEGYAYPFGRWRMDRGPYPFRWMAALEFPIERLTKDGPRK